MCSLNQSSMGTLLDVKSIIDDLKCSICLDYLNVPKTLTCQHSFCQKCLEPLVENGILRCPLCRDLNVGINLKTLQTNYLIDTLIKSLQKSSAACPSCSKIKSLSVCDHCSNVYCHDCKKEHLDKIIDYLSVKMQKLKNHSQSLGVFKDDLKTSESHALREMNNKMNELKNSVICLLDTRKQALFDEIVRFYAQKERAINLVIENASTLSGEVNELNDKIVNLKKNNITEGNSSAHASFLIKGLKSLESDHDRISDQFSKLTPKIDVNSNKLTIQCDKLENFQFYQSLIDSVKVKVPENDQRIFSKIRAKDRIKSGFQLTVKSIFGLPLQLDFDFDIDEIKVDSIKKVLIRRMNFDGKDISKIKFFDQDGLKLTNEQTEELAKKLVHASSPSYNEKMTNLLEKKARPDGLYYAMGEFNFNSL